MQHVMVINAGSSSIKAAVFSHQSESSELNLLYQAHIAHIGQAATLTIKNAAGEVLDTQRLGNADHESAFRALLAWSRKRMEPIDAFGHRVVHGGERYSAPLLLDEANLAQLEALIPLAPLHQPHNLRLIHILRKLVPATPQVACFDTAFHTTQPELARRFALPRAYHEAGMQRYGFHGTSYEYIARRLPELSGSMPDKVIIAHLGNGASLAALRDGKSIATSMGFSTLDGVPMGTRSGAIDPGVLLHLLRQGITLDALEHLLYKESGLLGVSGVSNDMAILLDSESADAQQAIALFIYRLSREIGSLAAALQGLDALVFTAGIGEHAAAIRAKLCAQLEWLGVKLDSAHNAVHAHCISHAESRVAVWVIPTNEEKMIAQHTLEVVKRDNCLQPIY